MYPETEDDQIEKSPSMLLTAIMLFSLTGMTAGAADYRFNMSYIYAGGSYTSLVDAAQGRWTRYPRTFSASTRTGTLL
jgi:hypothetical protein